LPTDGPSGRPPDNEIQAATFDEMCEWPSGGGDDTPVPVAMIAPADSPPVAMRWRPPDG